MFSQILLFSSVLHIDLFVELGMTPNSDPNFPNIMNEETELEKLLI